MLFIMCFVHACHDDCLNLQKLCINMGYIFKSFLTVSAFIVSCTAFCQKAAPTVTYYSQEDEADVVMSEGESQTCEAPLEIRMDA